MEKGQQGQQGQQGQEGQQEQTDNLNLIKANLKRQISLLSCIAIKMNEDNNRLFNKRRKTSKQLNIKQ
jgi:hypothetical protein